MILLYRLAFLPALLLALPYYALRMFRRGGYSDGFSMRLGFFPPAPKRPGVKRIWIQAVSVGEVEAVGPLLKTLREAPDAEVILTTTTSTGYRIAREKYASLTAATGLFPLDFLPCSRLAWRRIRPDLVVLTEGELWPEHLHRAKASGAPAVLINARLSDRSHARYAKVRPLARRLLAKLALALPGAASDAARFLDLGLPPERLGPAGNIKFDVDAGSPATDAERRALFAELFGENIPAGTPLPLVLLGSSTWPGEEAVLLGTHRAARAAGLDTRLLLVPRHAERRAEIAALLADASEKHYFRSKHRDGAPHPAEIVVADTTGELRRLTRVADLAFVGKSLPPHVGGQTPVECAALGVPLVHGPDMSNFRDIVRGLRDANASRTASDADAARAALLDLLRRPEERARMGDAARAWHAANRGATRRTADAILHLLRRPAS